jgi:hypothetical protein
MELKSYLINMILGFNNHKYTKLELYTLTCNELSTIKNDLHRRDDVSITN